MQVGCKYAFHIVNEEELIDFSEAEQEHIYDSLQYNNGGYVKHDLDRNIAEWNLARWHDATGNAHYDGSIYMTLYKHNDEAIVVGWDCNLAWMKRHGYEIIEWSDMLCACDTFTLPDLSVLLE